MTEAPGTSGNRTRGRHLWAKSSESGDGHSLFAHALDVGLAAECLLARDSLPLDGVAVDLGLDVPATRRWLITLAALHDLGKATPAFQRMWPQGAPAEANVVVTNVPHGKATIVLLTETLARRGIARRLAGQLAHAVGIHHGTNVTRNELDPTTIDERALGIGSEPWESWRTALCDDVIEAFAPGPNPTSKRYPTTRTWALLAGVTSIADWIGSSLPHAGEVVNVARYLEERREATRSRIADIGFPPGQAWWKESFDDVAGWFATNERPFTPRPLQQALLTAFKAGSNPGLIILEAPTGEGKTEAALLGMVQPDALNGAYFGLPTQATSDAMATRFASFKERHERRNVVLALAHAGARIPRIERSDAVDSNGVESDATAASWFSSGRRELLAELGVGTIDQALLAVLPTKHHFVRLYALAGRTLIVDEVHAYDTYTSSLLEALLTWAAALHMRVILMSATLPAATKSRLTNAYQRGLASGNGAVATSEAPAVPDAVYPRLTVIDRSGVATATSFAAVRQAQVRYEPAPHDPIELAKAVLAAAEAGGAIGVIVNTVDRAQAITRTLIDRGVTPLLLHARYPALERRAREQSILERLGPAGRPEVRAGVFVGTQVLEQSLDVDFDALFTDLSPIDLLLQRAGRLHRHSGRVRPTSHAEPLLRIAGDDVEAPVARALAGVYDAATLWRTWAALRDAGGTIRLPDDVDPLVQSVYGDALLAALERHAAAYDAAREEVRREMAVEAEIASKWRIPAPDDQSPLAWNQGFADDHEPRPYQARARTRLGDASLEVIPMHRERDGWRAWGGQLTQPHDAKRANAAWVQEALATRLRVQRRELLAALATAPLPPFWGKSGPLAFKKPLALDAAGRAIAWPSARLDPMLGLVYERS